MRLPANIRPILTSTQRRLADISRHRAAVRSIVHRSLLQRRWLNSSLAADQSPTTSVEHGRLSEREVKHALSTREETAVLTPMQRYRAIVDSGVLKFDPHQERIVGKLQKLHDELETYQPPSINPDTYRPSLFSRLFSRQNSIEGTVPLEQVPKGLYLFGDVGTGKTMLMDLFYDTLPPQIKCKRRVHFHAFMIDVHKRMHAMKAKLGLRGGDPIPPVARDLAHEAYVLCFDEFQVTDIADAMILRQLFERLLSHGVVCVITSNRHPDDLYKNGIQRSSFLPCIELLKTHFDVADLDSGTDYRRLPHAVSHVYYDPLTPENRAEVEKIFSAVTSDPADPVVHNRKLHTWGRTILVPESSSTVAKFEFDDLCGNPLSAADYLEITKNFKTIFVLDVPKMGLSQKDKARRFITFIDACYESKTKLFMTSEVPVAQIFAEDNKKSEAGVSDQMRQMMDDLGLPSDVVISSSVCSGEEELFAFARCCSRLVEMGSKKWVEDAGVS